MCACGGAANTAVPTLIHAGFQQTELVSDISGNAAHTDPFLINPRGVAFEPGQSFWIVDNNRSSAKVFDSSGNPAPRKTSILSIDWVASPEGYFVV
jgi:hypothetical protein